MIRDPHNPHGKFFMLSEDDMIMPGDEYYDYNEDRWHKVSSSHFGDLYKGPYGYDHFLVIRRLNPDYKFSHEPWI